MQDSATATRATTRTRRLPKRSTTWPVTTRLTVAPMTKALEASPAPASEAANCRTAYTAMVVTRA